MPRILRRPSLLALGVLAGLAIAPPAWGYWGGSLAAGGAGAARADSVNSASVPAASAAGRTVTVLWSATTLAHGQAVTGYLVKRYNADDAAVPPTISAGCSGTIVAVSCAEAAVPTGRWTYTVTPAIGTYWRGAESAPTQVVSIGAATLTLAKTVFEAPVQTPTTGSVTGFAANEAITYRLDSSTTLTGSPGVADANGNATITSLVIPASTDDGAHTVYAIGSLGTQASFDVVVNATPTLLSLNQQVTASSVQGATTPVTAAVDGLSNTRWSSAFSDPQWLQVDLGATAIITKVVLTWETAHATAYQIQTSNDATTWTPIYSTTAAPGGTETLHVNGTGRYVRMYGTARATGYGYSLWEFQIFGVPGTSACGTTNAALNRPATASSVENVNNNPASAAVDGDTATRWSSAFSDPQWLQIDLGATATICQVVLQWESAHASAYEIQVSDDATTWTSIYTTTTSSGGIETVNATGTGRYVRMYGTARTTSYGYSLWEFTVHTG